MKYVLAKTFGWDLEYIESIPYKDSLILLECMKIENEEQERAMKREQAKARFRRR